MDKDVVAVIGTGGMGQAIARRLGSGRKLLLADFDGAALEATAGRLADEGHDVATQVTDVSDEASVAKLAATAAELGRVTHLAHTAGLSPVQAPTEAILKVDLLGVALVLQEFGGVVAPGGAGVVIASMAGHMGRPLAPELERALATTPARELLALPELAPEAVGDAGTAYSVAKRANVVRVQAESAAWGRRGARLNSISPGVIHTPMGRQELDSGSGAFMRRLLDATVGGRAGTPEDIAGAAAFLLDPANSYVHGTDLLVDGGAVAVVRHATAS